MPTTMENHKRVVFPYANARTPTKPQGNQLSHRLSLRLSHRLSPNCPLIVPLKLRPNTPCPTEAQIVPTWNFAKNSVRSGVGGWGIWTAKLPQCGNPNMHKTGVRMCTIRGSECAHFGHPNVHNSGFALSQKSRYKSTQRPF